ncbi:hypothetical protein L6452_12743 [Arctium lappa]|uniref:Uncharacterized protein n=1 Tax=Arctium lappa TaxID=4217 RepID=A0ACB9CGB8_ARCLA|nr:hypothetical protein L6452_12743 [Arctium lappa]
MYDMLVRKSKCRVRDLINEYAMTINMNFIIHSYACITNSPFLDFKLLQIFKDKKAKARKAHNYPTSRCSYTSFYSDNCVCLTYLISN